MTPFLKITPEAAKRMYERNVQFSPYRWRPGKLTGGIRFEFRSVSPESPSEKQGGQPSARAAGSALYEPMYPVCPACHKVHSSMTLCDR